MYQCTTGGNNIALGSDALESITTGNRNVALGEDTLKTLSTGYDNIAIGRRTLKLATTTANCIGIGFQALESITTGNNNIAIGNTAGDNTTTGYNNISIGYNVRPASATTNNSITLGDANITKFRVPGIGLEADDGVLSLKTGSGSVAEARFYCESSNAHYVAIKSPAHSAYSGNVNFVLPPNGGTNGYFLKTDGSGNTSWAEAGGGVDSDNRSNTVAGTNAGSSFDGGAYNNSFFGKHCGQSLTNGDENTGMGYHCMRLATTASYNTGMGRQTLESLTTGASNTGVGNYVLQELTTGGYNAAFGGGALYRGNGSYNTGIGYNAGNQAIISGSNNTMLGNGAALSSNSVSNEVVIGNTSVTKFRIPGINVTLKDNGGTPTNGHVLTVDANGEAGFAAVSAGVTSDSDYNTVAGTNAGDSITSGEKNTVFGYDAGTSITDGDDNTCIGYHAGKNTTSGSGCVFIGERAGRDNTTASDNVCIGQAAGQDRTTGASNVSIGTLSNYTGNGTRNVSVGFYSLSTNPANYNTAVGAQALRYINNTNATGNVGVGESAGKAVTSGANNTLMGYLSGSSGTNDLTTGSNNIILGYNASASGATVSNEITLGNSSITKLRIPGISLEASASAVTQGGVFYENNTTVSSDYTITNGRNAMAAGPITIASGVTVTVGSGETLTIV